MADPGTTSAPAPAAPAPPTSGGQGSSAPDVSSPPPSSAKYGTVPKERSRAIFDGLDGEAGASAPAPAPGPEGPTPGDVAPTAAAPKTDATAEPAAPVEQLPQNLRKALEVIPDPKIRQKLADDHFRLRRWDRIQSSLGMKTADLEGYLGKALKVAPTPELLEQISTNAAFAQSLAETYNAGDPQSLATFAGSLLQANPRSFVTLLRMVMENTQAVAHGLEAQFGAEIANEFRAGRDMAGDMWAGALAANMRETAKQEGKEAYAEVADYIEEFCGLKEKAEKRKQPPTLDPKDRRIAELEAQRQQEISARVEAFNSSVDNAAEADIRAFAQQWVAEKGGGFNPEAQKEAANALANAIFHELANNKHILEREKYLDAQGRFDQAHFDAKKKFISEMGRRVGPQVAGPIMAKLRRLTEPAAQRRAQQLEEHARRRDPGSAGTLPAPADFKVKAGTKPSAIFDELDRRAES